jgi:hypothetical protein
MKDSERSESKQVGSMGDGFNTDQPFIDLWAIYLSYVPLTGPLPRTVVQL